MVGVSRRVEPGRQMALGADLVAGRAQLQAMWIMAVGAGHASLEHPALQEGAILVVLLLDLPIGKVDAGAEQAWHRTIEEWMTISEGFGDFVPSGVAEGASFYLAVRRTGSGPRRRADGWVQNPPPAAGVGEESHQTFRAVVGHARRRLRPGGMARAWPMASLARDIQLRPCRMIAVGRRIEVPLQVCRMAVGAHEVPGLVHPRPVQRVAGGNRLLGIEMKPALPTRRQRTAVPGK